VTIIILSTATSGHCWNDISRSIKVTHQRSRDSIEVIRFPTDVQYKLWLYCAVFDIQRLVSRIWRIFILRQCAPPPRGPPTFPHSRRSSCKFGTRFFNSELERWGHQARRKNFHDMFSRLDTISDWGRKSDGQISRRDSSPRYADVNTMKFDAFMKLDVL